MSSVNSWGWRTQHIVGSTTPAQLVLGSIRSRSGHMIKPVSGALPSDFCIPSLLQVYGLSSLLGFLLFQMVDDLEVIRWNKPFSPPTLIGAGFFFFNQSSRNQAKIQFSWWARNSVVISNRISEGGKENLQHRFIENNKIYVGRVWLSVDGTNGSKIKSGTEKWLCQDPTL